MNKLFEEQQAWAEWRASEEQVLSEAYGELEERFKQLAEQEILLVEAAQEIENEAARLDRLEADWNHERSRYLSRINDLEREVRRSRRRTSEESNSSSSSSTPDRRRKRTSRKPKGDPQKFHVSVDSPDQTRIRVVYGDDNGNGGHCEKQPPSAGPPDHGIPSDHTPSSLNNQPPALLPAADWPRSGYDPLSRHRDEIFAAIKPTEGSSIKKPTEIFMAKPRSWPTQQSPEVPRREEAKPKIDPLTSFIATTDSEADHKQTTKVDRPKITDIIRNNAFNGSLNKADSKLEELLKKT